jgi:hypothetical protein
MSILHYKNVLKFLVPNGFKEGTYVVIENLQKF